MSLPSLPDVPRERRRTATVVAVAVLGVVCLLALVLGLKGLFAPASSDILTSTPPPQPPPGAAGSSGSSGSSGAPGSAGSASATAPASSPTSPTAADAQAFSSPSGNIRCQISSAGARCDIGDRTWKPPAKPASCHAGWGQGLQVGPSGAGVVCASDALPGGPALAYGASVTRGDFRCDSSTDGVTCVHRPSRHGFSVARAAYALR